MIARKVSAFFHHACIAAVLFVALLWARSYRASDFIVHASQDGEVRRSLTIASSCGVLADARSATTANRDGEGIGLQFHSDPLGLPAAAAAALTAPVELPSRGGFVWMHRPHASGTPIEAAWTFAAMPWWPLMVLAAIPLLARSMRSKPLPALHRNPAVEPESPEAAPLTA